MMVVQRGIVEIRHRVPRSYFLHPVVLRALFERALLVDVRPGHGDVAAHSVGQDRRGHPALRLGQRRHCLVMGIGEPLHRLGEALISIDAAPVEQAVDTAKHQIRPVAMGDIGPLHRSVVDVALMIVAKFGRGKQRTPMPLVDRLCQFLATDADLHQAGPECLQSAAAIIGCPEPCVGQARDPDTIFFRNDDPHAALLRVPAKAAGRAGIAADANC